jgi:protein-disulfide isomerase
MILSIPNKRKRPMPRSLTSRLILLSFCLLAALALLPSRLAAAAEFTPDQRKEIEGIIKDFLANHPDLLMQAIQDADNKLKADAKDKVVKALADHRQQVFDDPQSPTAGNPKGDVTLVEFFDYRCPYCKQVEAPLEKLLQDDKQLRLVYKEFPVLGPDSELAAHVALAAKLQGKYDAFHRALMATPGHPDEAAIYKVAASVGLDIDRLKQDAKSPDIEKQLKANLQLGNTLDIDGTPAFIVGTTIVPGAISLEEVKQLIANTRAKG